MKCEITLTDTEDGQVRIDCNPTQPMLVKMRRGGDATPAVEYAILALAEIIKDSLKKAKEEKIAKEALLYMPGSHRLS